MPLYRRLFSRVSRWKDWARVTTQDNLRKYVANPALFSIQDRTVRQAGLDRVRDYFVGEVGADAVQLRGTLDPGHRLVLLTGELLAVPDGFADAVRAASKVTVTLNSIGGNSAVASEMIEALRGKDSEARIEYAGSSAALLALGCRRRLMRADAKLVIHSAVMAAVGDRREMLKAAAELETSNEWQAAFIAEHSLIPLRQCRRMMADGGDYTFDAEQALRAGLVDKVVPAFDLI